MGFRGEGSWHATYRVICDRTRPRNARHAQAPLTHERKPLFFGSIEPSLPNRLAHRHLKSWQLPRVTHSEKGDFRLQSAQMIAVNRAFGRPSDWVALQAAVSEWLSADNPNPQTPAASLRLD